MSIPAVVLARPEHRLLLLCACHVHSPSSKQEFNALIRHDLDWNYLLPRLRNHGLMPLFSHHVRGEEAALSEQVRGALQTEFSRGLQRRLKMLVELQQVVEFLTAQAVPVLAYKGPILAHIAYGTLALRSFSDLDLLVAPADKDRAVELLRSRGYKPETEAVLPDHLEVKRQLRDYEMALLPAQGAGALDLHWAVAPPYDGFPLHFEELWSRRVASPLSPSIFTFCREDLVLCLCAHGLKHRWHRLEWIGCLLAVLGREAEPLRWQQIEDTAAKLHCARALRLGLRLAFDLAAMDAGNRANLKNRVPEAMRRAVSADLVVKQLARQVWKTQFQQENNVRSEEFVSIPALVFAVRAREGRKARWAYVRDISRAFLVPASEDVPLDRPWSRVAYGMRLWRLILRRLHRIIVLRRF